MKTKTCKKVGYDTEQNAIETLYKLGRKLNPKKKPIRIYQCYCGKWHLTSRMDVKDISSENEILKKRIAELEETNLNLQKEINKYNYHNTIHISNNSTMNRFTANSPDFAKILSEQHKQIKLLQKLLSQKK